MEDDLQRNGRQPQQTKNGRQPPKKMEDDLTQIKNGRQPQYKLKLTT
jgi:hypothetical protein